MLSIKMTYNEKIEFYYNVVERDFVNANQLGYYWLNEFDVSFDENWFLNQAKEMYPFYKIELCNI